MSVAYFGSRISPHMTETPEGFLVCHDVPLSRAEYYEYYGREMKGAEGVDPDKKYRVLRRPDEVFSPAAMASFEGKAVTDEHPPVDLLTPENNTYYAKGHAQNIRKGTGKDAGYLIGDLVITDADLIREIQDGRREVSCGYGCKWVPQKNGVIDQQAIVGNHVAIVDSGRAGPHAAIKDSKSKNPTERGKNMSEKKGSIFGRMLKAFALDENTSPEDLEEAAKSQGKEEAKDAEPAKETPAAAPKAEPATPGAAKPDGAQDENPVMECLNKILARLDKLEAAKAPETADEDKDDLSALIGGEAEEPDGDEGGEGEELDPQENEESVTVPADNMPGAEEKEHTAADSTAMKAEVLRTRSLLAKAYKDHPAEFKAAAKDAAAEIKKAYGIGPAANNGNGGYAEFVKKTNKAKAQNAHDSAPKSWDKIYAEQQMAYDALNPHKKVNKEAK